MECCEYVYILCLYMHHFESLCASASSVYDHANVRALCVHACPHVCNYPFPQPSGPTTMKGCLC